MLKNKIFAFAGAILLFAGFAGNYAFAAETELPVATFEAETESDAEVAELKASLADLQVELAAMKTGMQDLQAKYIESEMEKLQAQLDAIRGTDSTSSTGISAADLNSALLSASLLDALPNSTTKTETEPEVVEPEITKIEDFVGFEVDDAITAPTDEEVAEEPSEIDALAAADAKIAELEALLAEKENDEEVAEPEVETSTALTAMSDGEALFQFSREISQKQKGATGAANLTADVLSASGENNFERGSAPKNNWNLFSPTGFAVTLGLLVLAVAIFVAWLVRNERRVLAATSRRFAQLEMKPHFDFKSHAKKSGKNNSNATDILK